MQYKSRYFRKERLSNLVGVSYISYPFARSMYVLTLLAGNRWHINCFRCTTCSTNLDGEDPLILMGGKSLICSNCSYNCSICKEKIEDSVILSRDQAFCATCFKCRNCKKKIPIFKYARTSQGIFCMDCHNALMQRRRKKRLEEEIAAGKCEIQLSKQAPLSNPIN